MAKVKVAVLGTGSLGQHHARIYSELQAAGQVELAGIFDAHPKPPAKSPRNTSCACSHPSPKPPPPATR